MNTKEIIEDTKSLIDTIKAACSPCGLNGSGDEYNIITQMFLYKYLNDKFGYALKRIDNKEYRERFNTAEHWEDEYCAMSEEEQEDLWDYLPVDTPKMQNEHLIATLHNQMNEDDFSTKFDSTMKSLGVLNADKFSIRTSGNNNVTLFDKLTIYVKNSDKRDDFARALIKSLSSTFSFENIFDQKYDFFATIFEYLIKDYNRNGGGTYGEYYTPHSVAMVMARLLVDDNVAVKNKTVCDPTAGTGTLLMALAHQIGENNCTIYSQDQSQKSTDLLRLNLILNGLVHSLPNVVQGDSLTDWGHEEADGTFKKFDYIVSNPPFNVDFSESVTNKAFENTERFFAGVPKVPKKDKESMAIYQCILQHILYIMKDDGQAAVVVPTGFLTKTGMDLKIRKKIVDNGWLRGAVSMPSNIFANTGTSVSVIFIDKREKRDDAVLIDASNLGVKEKVGKNQRTLLQDEDIEKIITTFKERKDVENFAKLVTVEDIKGNKYSLKVGQYFDIKIDYVDITEEEFNNQMMQDREELEKMFKDSHRLETDILAELKKLKFHDEVGK